jgi:hypothetical protein
MWHQIKTFFSKSQPTLEISAEQRIQPIVETSNEPVIKKLKRQASQQKDSKFGEKHSSSK